MSKPTQKPRPCELGVRRSTITFSRLIVVGTMLLSRLAFASSGPLRAASRRVAAPAAAALSSVAPPVDMSKFNQDQVTSFDMCCLVTYPRPIEPKLNELLTIVR